MNKKGVSGVIVSVLLILIVIAAVGILWAVISEFMKSNAERIEMGLNTVNLEIVENSMVYVPVTDELSLKVSRDSGDGTVSKLKFVVYDDSGESSSYTIEQSIGKLETKTVSIFLDEEVDYVSKVEVFPVAISERGTDYVGYLGDEEVEPGFTANWGMMAYWSFDNGMEDELCNGGSCTVPYCPTQVAGKRGKAYKFDRDLQQVIETGNVPDQSSFDEFSIGAWVKPAAQTINSGIISKMTDFSSLSGYAFYFNAAGNRMRIRYGTGSEHYPPLYSSSSFNFETDEWYHIAFTFDSGNLKLYLDGQLIDSTTGNPTPIAGNNLPYRIGAGYPTPTSFYFNGTLDDVRVYNRTLSETEISYLASF